MEQDTRPSRGVHIPGCSKAGRGSQRMKYLTDGSGPGDMAFNVWPVPVNAITNVPKTSAQVHDIIFANDVAQDSGAKDGSGTAIVQDLGDNLIPFPLRDPQEVDTRDDLCLGARRGHHPQPWLWQVLVGVHLGEQARSRLRARTRPTGISSWTTCHMRSRHRVWHQTHGQPSRNS